MSIKSWLLSGPSTPSSVNADTRRWLDVEQERHAELVARLRAEKDALREERDVMAADLSDEQSINAELAQALDERRPAPDPAWLGADLRRRWFATSDELTDDERWEQVAETAIDSVRGLWPLDHPTTAQAGCADAAVAGEPGAGTGELPASGVNYDEPLAEWDPPFDVLAAARSEFLRWAGASSPAAPQTSPGGEDTSSPQPGPSPSGDTTSDDVVAKAERYGDEIGRRDRGAAVASAAGLLRSHARGDDLSCFCGWTPERLHRALTDHSQHQAEQLAAVGLLDARSTP